MIYEISEHKPDFPFDLKHIRALGYPNDPSGGKILEEALLIYYYVLSKTLPKAKFLPEIIDTSGPKNENQKLDEILNMIHTQYDLRRNRVDYFTDHTLYNLRDFVEEHQKILQHIQEFRDNKHYHKVDELS